MFVGRLHVRPCGLQAVVDLGRIFGDPMVPESVVPPQEMASHDASCSVDAGQAVHRYASTLQVLPDFLLDLVVRAVHVGLAQRVPLMHLLADNLGHPARAAHANLVEAVANARLMAIDDQAEVLEDSLLRHLPRQARLVAEDQLLCGPKRELRYYVVVCIWMVLWTELVVRSRMRWLMPAGNVVHELRGCCPRNNAIIKGGFMCWTSIQ
mmetsp:Transcript_35609/g.98639  ORF Transcript_35609/g.98639 Transcript_35609/m.98639 type:complete len:209 (-) Transcript_35609:403-1029(-)